MTSRATSSDPLMICLSLPAGWAPVLNRSVEKLRKRFPEAPDSELLEIILAAGLYTIFER